MPIRVAVTVPGIMGSVLFHNNAGKHYEVWGENFRNNYARLLSNPTLLNWDGTPAESSLLENVYASNFIRWPKVRLWKKLLSHLSDHREFGKDGQTLKYSYDWRQSLLETARCLGTRLDIHAEYMENDRGLPREELRYVFLTHSMGGLVVRIALALDALDPVTVDRIIHIGSPLKGAPDAFRSAYQSGRLPLLRELSGVFNWRNADEFFNHLLRNVRTFPSLYQVMPPRSQRYLYYAPDDRSNPLTEDYIPQDKRRLANEAHQRLAEAEEVISKHNIMTFTIHSERHSKKKTDLEYVVQQLGNPEPGYKIISVHATTDEGDGTVPKWSAEGSNDHCMRKPVWNVTHLTMCNDRKVVELLPGILGP